MADEPEANGEAARVLRTGIALVHEGEWVLPAAGDEAESESADDPRAVVQYFFPVEIEVLAAADTVDLESVVRETLRRLAQGLRSV
jgi:hypothetical protein